MTTAVAYQSVSKGNGSIELWYTVSYESQPNNTSSISMGSYVHSPKEKEPGKKKNAKGQQKAEKWENTKKRHTKHTFAEGAGLILRAWFLFAGRISPIICPVDGPT